MRLAATVIEKSTSSHITRAGIEQTHAAKVRVVERLARGNIAGDKSDQAFKHLIIQARFATYYCAFLRLKLRNYNFLYNNISSSSRLSFRPLRYQTLQTRASSQLALALSGFAISNLLLAFSF